MEIQSMTTRSTLFTAAAVAILSLSVAGAAFAKRGADDAAGHVRHGGADDAAGHDAVDDNGIDNPATHDVADDNGIDNPATHDVGDDNGVDNPATHDVNDDKGVDAAATVAATARGADNAPEVEVQQPEAPKDRQRGRR
jgi:hypothetical protein